MDISFSWTTEALLAGKKTVTRRDWSTKHANKFKVGTWHWATNKQRRFGGKIIGRVYIVSIRREPLVKMLNDTKYGYIEIEKEGGLWKTPGEFVRLFGELRYGDPYRVEFTFFEFS